MSTEDGGKQFQGVQRVPCDGGCGGFLWATKPTTCDVCQGLQEAEKPPVKDGAVTYKYDVTAGKVIAKKRAAK